MAHHALRTIPTMSDCLLHPERDAAGSCEYCAQPHCAQCLQPLLGRRYCPPCLEQVRSVAQGGRSLAAARPGTQAPRPALPGWLSAALYLAGFLVLFFVSQFGIAVLFAVARAARGST